MAVFASWMKLFKIAFQYIVDNSSLNDTYSTFFRYKF